MLKPAELTSEEDKAAYVLSIGLPGRMLLKGHGGVEIFMQNAHVFGLQLLQDTQYFLQMQGFFIVLRLMNKRKINCLYSCSVLSKFVYNVWQSSKLVSSFKPMF